MRSGQSATFRCLKLFNLLLYFLWRHEAHSTGTNIFLQFLRVLWCRLISLLSVGNLLIQDKMGHVPWRNVSFWWKMSIRTEIRVCSIVLRFIIGRLRLLADGMHQGFLLEERCLFQNPHVYSLTTATLRGESFIVASQLNRWALSRLHSLQNLGRRRSHQPLRFIGNKSPFLLLNGGESLQLYTLTLGVLITVVEFL